MLCVPNCVAELNGFGGTYVTRVTVHIIFKFKQRVFYLYLNVWNYDLTH